MSLRQWIQNPQMPSRVDKDNKETEIVDMDIHLYTQGDWWIAVAPDFFDGVSGMGSSPSEALHAISLCIESHIAVYKKQQEKTE